MLCTWSCEHGMVVPTQGNWEGCLWCPAEWGTHPWSHFSFLRLRVQKPSYCFPRSVLHPLCYHVQVKHLSCVPERASVLVLALREKSRCWAEKPRFQRECIQTRPEVTRPGCTWVCTLCVSVACQSLNHCP